MNLVFDYSPWLVIVCIIVGLVYSGVLYYRDQRLAEASPLSLRLMAAFRFIAVTILCILLLSPLLKTVNRTVEKPIVVVAQDNSESVPVNKDSAFYRNQYKQNLRKLIDELSSKYEVRTYSFGDRINEINDVDSIKFNEKQTDISSLFKELEIRYSNRNLGAVIIGSDGLYNIGSNPVYASEKIKAPVYAIGLGDTLVKKDAILSKVEFNRYAYLGNEFPLNVIVTAKQLKGKQSLLTITKGESTVFSQNISFTSDAFQTVVPVLLEAKEIGLQHYKIKIAAVADEMTLSNNSTDVFIEVLDDREKVLILSDVPHPDVAALKQSIESNQNYEVESYTLDQFDKPLQKYNLVILHSIPGERNSGAEIIKQIKSLNIPVWAFSGAGVLLNKNLSIQSRVNKSNEVEPVLDQNFALFTVSEDLRKAMAYFPPVDAPFGSFEADNSSNAILYQRIGMVDTKVPLMYFDVNGENKSAVFQGEGIWRWRLQDFASNGSHQLFDEFVSKTVQFLSVKVDKSFFRVKAKNNYFANEAIEFDAEAYNESYELINDPEVTLILTNADNKKFNYTFSKTSNAYHLNAGTLPVGEYKYDAKVIVGTKSYSAKGEFSVSALKVELTNTVADHQLLYSLAKKHNGELIYPSDMDKLAEKLMNRDDIKSISYSEKKLTDVIQLKWIFFLLLTLLAAEWFMRKRNGAY
jgi:hypothetical protein